MIRENSKKLGNKKKHILMIFKETLNKLKSLEIKEIKIFNLIRKIKKIIKYTKSEKML